MPCTPESIMPGPFTEFPYASSLHYWERVAGHLEDFYVLQLWYPSAVSGSDFSALLDSFGAAWDLHAQACKWLGERFDFRSVPTFETREEAAFGTFAILVRP